ncbi:MAG: cytochrome c3 family protein [Desulfobacterales bacterium]
MSKRSLIVMCLVGFFLLSSAWVIAAGPFIEEIDEEDSLCFPVGMLSLGAPGGVEMTRSAVDFPHSRHMTYSCDTCHHKWEYHAILDTCSASGCHDLTEAPENAVKDGKYTEEGIRYYKYAYHVMCRDCHRDINAKNRDTVKKARYTGGTVELMRTGPVGCVECHPE